ncbi:MAG: DNA starvation/stationary phase protection protein Dps [Chloroflexota bacterium]
MADETQLNTVEEIEDDSTEETVAEELEATETNTDDVEDEDEDDDEDEDEESDAETYFTTRIDIEADTRVEAIDLLNQHIADMTDLYTQTKQAHWNVRGMNFQQLHELFDQRAVTLPELIDQLAERAGTLGGYAMGTIRMAAESSRLPEYPLDVTEGILVVEAMAQRWAQYAAFVREAIDEADDLDDDATEDLFTEIQRSVDKSLWFIEAHLQ